MMTIFWVILLSAIAGSFSNMLIYRLNKELSLFKPAFSICPKCKKRLRFWDLLPLLSFVFLSGKCRYCQKKISIRYFLVESAFVISGILSYFFHLSWELSLINYLLIVIIFSDLEYQQIPYFFSGSLLVTVFLEAVRTSFYYHNILFVGLFVIFIKVLERYYYKKPVFGDADIFLFFIFSVYFPGDLFLLFLYLSFCFGALFMLPLIVLKRVGIKNNIPFAPFIAIAYWTTQYYGLQIMQIYGKLIYG